MRLRSTTERTWISPVFLAKLRTASLASSVGSLSCNSKTALFEVRASLLFLSLTSATTSGIVTSLSFPSRAFCRSEDGSILDRSPALWMTALASTTTTSTTSGSRATPDSVVPPITSRTSPRLARPLLATAVTNSAGPPCPLRRRSLSPTFPENSCKCKIVRGFRSRPRPR